MNTIKGWLTSPWFKDAAERVVRAFIAGFLAVTGLNQTSILSVSELHAAAIGGCVAAISAVLSILATFRGGVSATPASLVKEASTAYTPRHAASNEHPGMKLGLLPHDPATPLLEIHWSAGAATYSPSVDNMTGVTAGLDENDSLGDCGPTSIDNHRRITTKKYGTEEDAPIAAVLDLYAAATSPPFNPATGANDNGVQNPALMAAVKKVGLDGTTIVAYGKLADTSDASVYTAIDTFGCVIFGVVLQIAQQAQSQKTSPVWDYVKGSGTWGGHDIVAGKYDSATGIVDVFSWAMLIGTTSAFRKNCLTDVWIPLWPEMLTDDAFKANVDEVALAADFKALTGATFPVAPTPAPVPVPPASADAALAPVAAKWVKTNHTGTNGTMAAALKVWLAAQVS